jgi:hypothetical protein
MVGLTNNALGSTDIRMRTKFGFGVKHVKKIISATSQTNLAFV